MKRQEIAGWAIMHQYLYHDDKTQPKLKYFETCYDSIRTLPSLIHDKNKPEDLDSNGEDHTADRDRYFLQTIRSKKTLMPMTENEKAQIRFNQKIGINRDNLLNSDRWNI